MITRESVDEQNHYTESDILLQHLKLTRKLGMGGFGYVYEGSYLGKKVAIKKMHSNRKNRMIALESLRAELLVVRMNLNHPNIVQTIGTTTSGREVDDLPFLVMEFAGSRNLQSVIDDPSETLDAFRRVKFACDICRALDYAHSKGIVHLDVKPANVILDDTDTCKLGDFGCAQRVGEGDTEFSPSPSITGTTVYRAPELLKGFLPQCSADMYSMGVVLWTLLTRETPYGAENLQVITWGVVALNLRPEMPRDDHGETNYKELFVQCWDADASLRPTAAQGITKLQAMLPN